MVVFRRFLSSRLAVVVVGFVLAAPAALHAAPGGDPAAVNKVTELNKKALAAYSQQDWDTAKELLRQALQICAEAGLDQHPITARTHIHYGAVAITGYNQREAGVRQFKKALEIEPGIKLTKSIVTPQLQDAFEEAELASNGGGDGSSAASSGGGSSDSGGGEDTGGNGAAASGDGDNAAPAGDDEGEATPRRRPPPHRARKHRDDDDDSDEAGAGATGGGFYLGLTIGSGAGIASGSAHLDPAHKLASPGFAPGQLGQIEPQIGYFLSSKLLLSLALRLQYVSSTNGENACGPNGTSYCNPTTYAMAALARATWFVGDGPFHWTFGGQLGGGYVAHAVSFSQTNCGMNGNTGCVDALLGGPFLIGPTFGLWYDLGSTVGLIAAVNSEIGAPKFTFNFDVDVGLGFRL
jgi:hypothetical protein